MVELVPRLNPAEEDEMGKMLDGDSLSEDDVDYEAPVFVVSDGIPLPTEGMGVTVDGEQCHMAWGKNGDLKIIDENTNHVGYLTGCKEGDIYTDCEGKRLGCLEFDVDDEEIYVVGTD